VKIVKLPGDMETDTILEKLSKGEFDYTIADENLADIHIAFYENLEKGGAVSGDRELAWAVRPGDTQLRDQINGLLRELKKQPLFNVLKKKYFQATRSFKKSKTDKFYAAETGTLSQYDALIRKHARRHGVDWRLVAAQIYQESHFDLTKRSWVGALGLFQIMPKTAKQLGIKDPHHPEQSIAGGLKYMKQLMKHYKDVPDDVERYRFAMAAYNAGFGHVDDARKLARQHREDDKHWRTVAKWLLKLSKREWFSKVRFGFCRGFEPVDYVRHIDERYAGYAQLVPLEKPEWADAKVD
jgi:membrane-bound lytic murein transglycosylase F